MRSFAIRTLTFGVLPVIGLSVLTGCGSGRDVPDEVTVVLPDGTEETVTLGSGVLQLADTSWDISATTPSGQGVPFVRLSFGPEGELASFENSTLAQEIFGATILFDGVRHNTTQAGLQYAAATYGAATSDSSGFTFEARVTAFAAGIEAANATASAVGEFDPDDANIMTGTFSFSSRVTLIDIPEGNQDMEFTFLGRRVTGE